MSVDSEVLQQASDWLDKGRRVYLITVARTWGTSPRPPGSLAAIRDDGVLSGSVSGGCVEEDLAERIRNRDLLPIRPQKEMYGATHKAGRFGLPCGATLELIIEPLVNDQTLQTLMRVIGQRGLILRRVNLTDGMVSLHEAQDKFEFSYHDDILEKVFGPVWHLLIIGAGQLSGYLARMALMLDYRVIICDPRKEYSCGFQLPGVEVMTDMPDDVVRKLKPDCRTAIVALTHDPKLDDMALLEALESQAFYVGAIGSRSNDAKRRQRLASFDLSTEQLSQLHGPVGLPIGSRTPPEIAISILAEMTHQRRNTSFNTPASGRSHYAMAVTG